MRRVGGGGGGGGGGVLTCKSDGALGDPALLEVPRAQEWGPSLTDVVVTWYALRFKLPLKLGIPLITIYHPDQSF